MTNETKSAFEEWWDYAISQKEIIALKEKDFTELAFEAGQRSKQCELEKALQDRAILIEALEKILHGTTIPIKDRMGDQQVAREALDRVSK